jgi:hypothetical protein
VDDAPSAPIEPLSLLQRVSSVVVHADLLAIKVPIHIDGLMTFESRVVEVVALLDVLAL